MKIGVVGCGALGSFYGARLFAAGADVHFLLRSDYDVVQSGGVRIRSIDGDFHVYPKCALKPETIGLCDLVLVGLKTTANRQFPMLLPPLVGPNTAVLTLQNGLGNEAQIAALCGAEQVLGGLCFVCLNRVAPGTIEHTAHGNVTLGEFSGSTRARTFLIARELRRAGIRAEVTVDLERAHWEKLVWNIPFNGLGVASAAGLDAVRSGQFRPGWRLGQCLTTQDLLSDPNWTQLVRELMREVTLASGSLGKPILMAFAEDRIERTRRMGPYKPSTVIDFERGQPLELESMFLEPLRLAEGRGVPMPRLAALGRILAALDPAGR